MAIKMTFYCDICNAILPQNCVSMDVGVIFLTEQTEGRSTDPYFSLEKIHICDECKKTALDGSVIWAIGAQGHNQYSFTKKF